MKGCVFLMSKNKTKILVLMALFIALSLVCRILSFQTPIAKISFGFVPNVLCSMMLGPWIGGITAALSDVVGMLVYSRGLPYFPGYTLSAALYGISYGLFLYGREKSYRNIILCIVLQTLVIELGLGTVWGYLYTVFFTNNAPLGLLTILGTRAVPALIMLPIQVVVTKYLAKLMEHTPFLERVS